VAPRAPYLRAGLAIELNEHLAPIVRLGLERQLDHDTIALKHVVLHAVTHFEGAPELHIAQRPCQRLH